MYHMRDEVLHAKVTAEARMLAAGVDREKYTSKKALKRRLVELQQQNGQQELSLQQCLGKLNFGGDDNTEEA